MRRLLLLAFIFALKSSVVAQSFYWYNSDVILIDPNVIRGQFAYGRMDMKSLGKDYPNRYADGIDLKAEIRIGSSAMDKYNQFAVYDAFYIDLFLGKMQTPPTGSGNFIEGKFAMNSKFGYDFLLGYRNKRLGAFAGIRPRCAVWSMGDLMLGASGDLPLRFEMPYCARLEFRPFGNEEFRIQCTAWSNLKTANNRTQGIRVEVPFFFRRWFLFGEIDQSSFRDDLNYATSTDYSTATTSYVGFRIGSIY